LTAPLLFPGGLLKPRAGLFVTCLVDLFRPSVGFAAATLIEVSGCTVEVPEGQTCCGQPAYNSGDQASARAIGLQTIRAFAGVDYIVVPSGSCAAMLKLHIPRLFDGDPPDVRADAAAFAARVHELTSFLVHIRGMTTVPGIYQGRVTYHDACSGLRELSIKTAPRTLLASMAGVDLIESDHAEACCGFGGLFAEKYPGISDAILSKKVDNLTAAAAPLVLSGDLGCLMNIAGKCSRDKKALACRHVAEVLAGELTDPPIASR
jgi:L-lactate dehydrogenase complex protein LldE